MVTRFRKVDVSRSKLKVQYAILKYINCDDEDLNRKKYKGFGW